VTRLVIPLCFFVTAWLVAPGCVPDPAAGEDAPTEAAGEAAPASADTAPADPALATEDAADSEGGKSANPGRDALGGPPPVGNVTWEEAPLELGFPTKKGWQIHRGQGMCKPVQACQELKAVREGEEKPLETRLDVSGLVSLIAEKDHAQALVRFFTDHRFALSDEPCSEVGLTEEGELDFRVPEEIDLEAPLPAHPVKVVDFEGGFRVERTLICVGEEKDKLVWVAETVFTPGNWEREEVQVLLEHEGLVLRLK
jgi:hypothetical protein